MFFSDRNNEGHILTGKTKIPSKKKGGIADQNLLHALLPGAKIDNGGKITVDIGISKETMIFNVGGTRFETYKSTLFKQPNSPLADDNFLQRHFREDRQDYFFDRDPDIFKVSQRYRKVHAIILLLQAVQFWTVTDTTTESSEIHDFVSLFLMIDWEVLRNNSPVLLSFIVCKFALLCLLSESCQPRLDFWTIYIWASTRTYDDLIGKYLSFMSSGLVSLQGCIMTCFCLLTLKTTTTKIVWGAVLLFISKMWYHLAFDVISPRFKVISPRLKMIPSSFKVKSSWL